MVKSVENLIFTDMLKNQDSFVSGLEWDCSTT